MSFGEMVVAIMCLVGGALLQYRAGKMRATDMQILGAMFWVAGLIILADARWHFLTTEAAGG